MLKLSKSPRTKRLEIWRWLFLIVGIGLIGYGIYGFWQKYQATHQPASSQQQAVDVVTRSTNTPDETPVASCDRFIVSDNQPQKISIPSLGIDGCIQKVGVDQHNAIAVPTNIHVAGWFTDSARPGGAGVSIIDGHAGGRYADGIFKQLDQLSPKDIIEIQFGDEQKRRFAVVSVDSYTVKETSRQQYTQLDNVESQLTLVTCGGTYNSDQQSYDQRVVVRSKLLP